MREESCQPVGSFNQDLRGKGAACANKGFWGQTPCILSQPPPVSSQKGQEGYLGCLKPTMPPIPTATNRLNFTVDFPPKNHIFSHQTPCTNSQTVANECLSGIQTSWGIAPSSSPGPHYVFIQVLAICLAVTGCQSVTHTW